MSGSEREYPTVRLIDEGLEVPEHLVGRTGQIRVDKPEITMDMSYVDPGVQEIDRNMVVFPTTDKDPINVPEGHVRIAGEMYRIVDDRDLNECPECGSDKVAACDVPPKCYNCDTEIDRTLEAGSDRDGGDRRD